MCFLWDYSFDFVYFFNKREEIINNFLSSPFQAKSFLVIPAISDLGSQVIKCQSWS